MKIIELDIADAAIVESTHIEDNRGCFARFFCMDEMKELFFGKPIQQINYSMSRKQGTVRGMHYQSAPMVETKAVRCLQGHVFDVIVDLRKNSPTYGEWRGTVLDADRMNMLIVPTGCAHGFQTLEDDCSLLYLHSEFYCKEHEGGVRFDSPDINIDWPLAPTEISERDLNLPVFNKNVEGLVV